MLSSALSPGLQAAEKLQKVNILHGNNSVTLMLHRKYSGSAKPRMPGYSNGSGHPESENLRKCMQVEQNSETEHLYFEQ